MMNREVEAFAVGNEHLLDQRLVKYDCIASIAHARVLRKAGIIGSRELKALVLCLGEIAQLNEKGRFIIRPEQEDCHTAIENYLTARLGNTGKRIHSGRSRNDQVIAALRLYEREALDDIGRGIQKLVAATSLFSRRYRDVPIPGYTHLRKAMPYSVGKWAGAFGESLRDDLKLLGFVSGLISQCPLGSAAGYGVPFIGYDRRLASESLGFCKVQENTLYVQNSRGKFELMVLDALNQVMLDLNKLATDIWLYSSEEFGYLVLPEEFAMGSSIMPQKRNPDVLELVRAKAAVFKGCIDTINNLLLGLPSGYNADFKLTKEPLFSGIDAAQSVIDVMAVVMSGITVNRDRCRSAMTPELLATGKVNELVLEGVPFRDAYRRISASLSKKNHRRLT
ncbi:argininosuccinate lyase [Candidatus Woesearchaeota archaeon]|nr:argininosuccinate lyase [Candidatus Woesearchaeota archaeon]